MKQVKKRDPDFDLKRARLTKVAGAEAVEVVGDQVISRARLRTRSVHIYKGKAEYVIELLAPVEEFARIDRAVFEPLLGTLEVTGKVKEPRKRKGKRKRGRDRN